MWLEGAVQNHWSIADMRAQRAEVLGTPADGQALDGELNAELDEDAESITGLPPALEPSLDLVRGHSADEERADRDSEDDDADEDDEHAMAGKDDWDEDQPTVVAFPSRSGPFAHLASLPADVSDAFEGLKLCIVEAPPGLAGPRSPRPTCLGSSTPLRVSAGRLTVNTSPDERKPIPGGAKADTWRGGKPKLRQARKAMPAAATTSAQTGRLPTCRRYCPLRAEEYSAGSARVRPRVPMLLLPAW